MKKSQLKEIIREMIAQELEEGRIDQLRTKVDTAIKNDPHLVARKNTMRRISQQYAGASPDEKIPTNFGLAHTTPARVRDDAIKSWGKKPQKVSEQELSELRPSTYKSVADKRDDQANYFYDRNPAASDALAKKASNLRKFAREKEIYGSISPATARKVGIKKELKEIIREMIAQELEEGKWNYPKDIRTPKKPDEYLGSLQRDRAKEARKAHRKDIKAKAHAALKSGDASQKVSEQIRKKNGS